MRPNHGDQDGAADTAAYTAYVGQIDAPDAAATADHVAQVDQVAAVEHEIPTRNGTELSSRIPRQLAERCRAAGRQGLLPSDSVPSLSSSRPSGRAPRVSGRASRLVPHEETARPETEETVHLQVLQQTVH